MKKIIAIVLLIAGIGLIALAGFSYFTTPVFAACEAAASRAEQKRDQMRRAKGTAEEEALAKASLTATEDKISFCENAAQVRQFIFLIAFGGLAALVGSGVLLFKSRKRETFSAAFSK